MLFPEFFDYITENVDKPGFDVENSVENLLL